MGIHVTEMKHLQYHYIYTHTCIHTYVYTHMYTYIYLSIFLVFHFSFLLHEVRKVWLVSDPSSATHLLWDSGSFSSPPISHL